MTADLDATRVYFDAGQAFGAPLAEPRLDETSQRYLAPDATAKLTAELVGERQGSRDLADLHRAVCAENVALRHLNAKLAHDCAIAIIQRNGALQKLEIVSAENIRLRHSAGLPNDDDAAATMRIPVQP